MATSNWLDKDHHGHAFPGTDHDVIYCGNCGLESCFWSQCPCVRNTDEQAAADAAYADKEYTMEALAARQAYLRFCE